MLEKEKDVAFLKYNLHELKTNFNDKMEEISFLKKKAAENEGEIKQMKTLNQQMTAQFEREIELLRKKNQVMECKVISYESKLELEKVSQDKNTKTIKNEMEEMMNKLSEKINVLSTEIVL